MYLRLPAAAACPILGGAMPPVSCRVLGPVRVTVAGADAPAELLWRKHVALLVYLARSPRKSRTREHLISLLWSDRDERQARHSLSEALRVLRRALGDERLVADVDQVRLAPDAVTLDCTSEPAARAALRALTLAGDRAEALRVADELARALHDTLGAEVSEETARLVARVRDTRVGRRVVAAPPDTRPRPPLVGRRDE